MSGMVIFYAVPLRIAIGKDEKTVDDAMKKNRHTKDLAEVTALINETEMRTGIPRDELIGLVWQAVQAEPSQ